MTDIERLRRFVQDMTRTVRRHIYAPETGAIKSFVSGYSNSVIPNLWDRSAEMRAG